MSRLRLCLIGSGIAGSPSPAMHNAGLAALGIDGAYELRETTSDGLPGFVAELRAGAWDGCNVTIPLKRAAADACDALEGDAATLSAVNTITVRDGRLSGSNTDAAGFCRSLHKHGVQPDPSRPVVVLGAGGAAAAVGLCLLRESSRVHIAARRTAAAAELAARLGTGCGAVAWHGEGLQNLLGAAGLVVNATPAKLAGLPVDVRTLPASCTVADVRYRPRPVDLVIAASARGLRAFDGAEMLLQQALLSLEAWTGRPAPDAAMRQALAEALA